MTIIVRGRYVIPAADRPVAEDGAVVVEDGRVAAVLSFAEASARHPAAAVIGGPNAAVLPGFINAHHHGHAPTSVQQAVPEDILEPWLLSWAAARQGDRYLDTLLSGGRLLGTGVTTTVDVWAGGGSAEAYADGIRAALRGYSDSGIRAAFAAGTATRSHLVWGEGEDERFVASLPEALRPAARSLIPPVGLSEDEYFGVMADLRADLRRGLPGDGRVDLWFAFPGPQWVPDSFMQRIAAAAAAADTNVQTHVDESLYEKLHGRRAYGRDTILHLAGLGILGPRFSIAHGVWLTDAEIAVMAETGSAVSHNPGSNLRLHAGVAPVNRMRAAGVTVGLGMDAMGLSDDEDMFAEMRLALRLNREPVLGAPAMAARDVLALATLGGAKLLRREASLGRLAPGYLADIVVVDLARAMWPWVAPETDPVDLVMLRAARGDVDTVLVGGEVVWRQGAPVRFDAAAAGREFAARMAATAFPAERAAAMRAVLPHLRAWYEAWPVPALEPVYRYNSRV